MVIDTFDRISNFIRFIPTFHQLRVHMMEIMAKKLRSWIFLRQSQVPNTGYCLLQLVDISEHRRTRSQRCRLALTNCGPCRHISRNSDRHPVTWTACLLSGKPCFICSVSTTSTNQDSPRRGLKFYPIFSATMKRSREARTLEGKVEVTVCM